MYFIINYIDYNVFYYQLYSLQCILLSIILITMYFIINYIDYKLVLNSTIYINYIF